ncbi:LysR family transcriptional regulator [Vibrio mediterranei]|uniref:LysR family transcriptional regulator n=1 Tax=Vibrio mediterranei TaxID=689 RepID=UPI00406891F9
MENLNLRTIKVLLSLHETENTYQTADKMGISQSAVARTLAKAREALNNPLFIRQGRAFLPTPLMNELASKWPDFIENFENLADVELSLDPFWLTGQYHIYLNSHIKNAYGASLFQALSTHSPKATWIIEGWDSMLIDDLLNQRAAIGVGFYQEDLPKVIAQDVILEDKVLLLANAQHPLHHYDTVELEQLGSFGFITHSKRYQGIDLKLEALPFTPIIPLHTDCMELAIKVAQSQPLLLTTTASCLCDVKNTLLPVNINMPQGRTLSTKTVCLYAQEVADKPFIRWLKHVIREVIHP